MRRRLWWLLGLRDSFYIARYASSVVFLLLFFCLVLAFKVPQSIQGGWHDYIHCPGADAVYIPANEKQQLAACSWNDTDRPPLILYGTIKGAGNKQYQDKDPFSPFIIMDRTLRNWASLPGVQPVIFTEDESVITWIEEINMEIKSDIMRRGQQATYRNVIHYIQEFEHGTKVKRAPTYRGMLRAIVQAYPAADLFVFANADILFTSSLLHTARFVQRYYDCVVKPNNPLMHGIFVTGSRVNVAAPQWWNPWTNASGIPRGKQPRVWRVLFRWEQYLMRLANSSGERYTGAAMDYFIYTPDLFDWNYDLAENDYLVGGVEFDTVWFASAMRRAEMGEAFVVESSCTLLAVHQNNNKDVRVSVQTLQSTYNQKMGYYSGAVAYYYHFGEPSVAPFYLSSRASSSRVRYQLRRDYLRPLHPMHVIRRKKCYRVDR